MRPSPRGGTPRTETADHPARSPRDRGAAAPSFRSRRGRARIGAALGAAPSARAPSLPLAALTLFAVACALASTARPALAQADPPPPANGAPAGAAADELAAARARQAELAGGLEAARAAGEARVRALEAERAALAARIAAAAPEEQKRLKPDLDGLDGALAVARERARAADALAAAQQKLVVALEQRARRQAEGPAALGIVVPASPAEVEAALKALDDADAAIERRARAARDAEAEAEARAAEAAAAERALADSAQGLAGLDAADPARVAAEAAHARARDRAEVARARAELATVTRRREALALDEARAALAMRQAALDKADPAAVVAARERLARARAEAEVEAEARRAREAEAERDRLQRMRAEAASRAAAAAEQLDSAQHPRVKELALLERDNADRVGRLADLEERRREVAERCDREADAWASERAELALVLERARAGGLTAAESRAHLALLRGRLAGLDADGLASLERRERAAAEAAEQSRRDLARLDSELAELDKDPAAGTAFGRKLAAAHTEARTLTRGLYDAAREVAWGFDKLAELVGERRAHYERDLADPAFDVLYFGNTREQLWRGGVVVLATALASLLAAVFLRILLGLTRRTRWTLDELAVRKLRGPLRLALYLIGLFVLLRIVTLPPGLRGALTQILRALIVLDVAYALFNAVDIVERALEPFVRKSDSKLDDQLLPLLARIGKVLVAVVGVVEVAATFGYNLTTVLAGVGVGGVALALAAKDAVSNLFGSIMIFTDKPFEVGDWIKLSGCEGVVEEIGLRSTKIRTWEDTLVTLPNSTIGSTQVENVSRFKARRVYMHLGIRYDTPVDKVERAVEIVREVLDGREDVKPGHYVFFNDLKESSLNIMVYYFVRFTTWRIYLTTRQEVTLAVMRRFEAEGVRFAFPTRTLELEPQGALGGAERLALPPGLPAGGAPAAREPAP